MGKICIRGWGEQCFGQQWRIHAAIQRNIPERFPVVTIFQRDELAPLVFAAIVEPVERHLQRDFNASRAVVGKKHFGQGSAVGLAWGDREQALGELHRRWMREPRKDDVFQLRGLRRDCRRDTRLCVTKQIGPPAADCIKVAPAILPDEPRPFATSNRYQWQPAGMQGARKSIDMVLAHLGAGMPEDGKIARPPLIGVRYHRRDMNRFTHLRIIAAKAGATPVSGGWR